MAGPAAAAWIAIGVAGRKAAKKYGALIARKMFPKLFKKLFKKKDIDTEEAYQKWKSKGMKGKGKIDFDKISEDIKAKERAKVAKDPDHHRKQFRSHLHKKRTTPDKSFSKSMARPKLKTNGKKHTTRDQDHPKNTGLN